MNKKIIIFSGKKGVGKDTCAGFLGEALGWYNITFTPIPFAFILKDFCQNVLGLTYEQCYGTDDQKNQLTGYQWDNTIHKDSKSGPMSAREVMQYFGTDVMRNQFDTDVWVKGTMNFIDNEHLKLDSEIAKKKVYIITDCRFPNEVDIPKLRDDTFIIRIKRDTGYVDNHPSETALDNYPEENYDLVLDLERDSLDVAMAEMQNLAKRIFDGN